MEWSNEIVLEFLQLYELEPSIWNPKHPNYKIRDIVHDAWNRISKNLNSNFPIVELKKKKKNLMATYRKLLTKVRMRRKTRLGADKVYKPKWFAYELMAKFLHGIYQPNATQSSEVSTISL